MLASRKRQSWRKWYGGGSTVSVIGVCPLLFSPYLSLLISSLVSIFEKSIEILVQPSRYRKMRVGGGKRKGETITIIFSEKNVPILNWEIPISKHGPSFISIRRSISSSLRWKLNEDPIFRHHRTDSDKKKRHHRTEGSRRVVYIQWLGVL